MTSRTAEVPVRRAPPATAAAALVVAAVLALAPYLWRLATGTRRLPNDDNWAYWRIFQTFEESGRIVLIDWNDINLVGMLPVTRAWTAVVGNGPLQVHLLGSVMAFVVLLSVRSLLRSLDAPWQVLGVATVGVSAGFVVTAGTFMADQFAAAGALASLALAVRVVDERMTGPLGLVLVALAALAALYAFSVRQQTAVAAVGTFAVLALARAVVPRLWILYAALLGPSALVFYAWRSGLPDGGGLWFRFEPSYLVAAGVLFVVTVALAALPLVLALEGRHAVAPVPIHVAVSVVAAVAAVAVDPAGYVNDSLSILRRIAEAGPLVRVLGAVALVNVLVYVVHGASRRRLALATPSIAGLAVAALLSLAADGGSLALASDYYPRYSLVSVALVVVLLASSHPAARPASARGEPLEPRSSTAAAGAVVLIGLSSYWAMDGALSPLRAVQEAADIAECAGVPPERFDGGVVWMGLHHDGTAVSQYWNEPMVEDGLPPTQHQRIFPGAERDAVLLDDRPADGSGGVVATSLEASGLLPGNDVTRWLVVRSSVAEDVAACIEAP